MTKASGMGSRWAPRRGEEAGRAGAGPCQGPGGQLGSGAAAFPLHTPGLELSEELVPSCSVGEGVGGKAKGQEMEMGELVSMEMGIQWTAAHVYVLEC